MYSRFKALEKYNLQDIQNSEVVIVGLGATGSVIAENLARHGVNLVLIDRDYLEMNDLYSSNLYDKKQCEKALPKAKAAEKKLSEFTQVESHITDLRSKNTELLNSDLIMDGTDNLETRLLIDKFSKENNIPWIYTAALGERGFSMFVQENCFQCLFEKVNPKSSCELNGVMREVSSIAASKSTLKAIKHLSGQKVDNKLEIIPEMEKFALGECSCKETELESSQVCGENKYQVSGDKTPEAFKGREIASNKYLRRLEINDSKITIFNSGRAIIEASSQEKAEALYREASSI